jgi:hypothetical protein
MRASYFPGMTEPKKYVRAEPTSKDKMREMLAQAVRNTQPEKPSHHTGISR